MKNSDIERSEIVRKIIDIYNYDVSNNNNKNNIVRPSWAATTPDEFLSSNKFDFDALYRRREKY